MTRDNFKRALEIENELSQLRPLQREIEKNTPYNSISAQRSAYMTECVTPH